MSLASTTQGGAGRLNPYPWKAPRPKANKMFSWPRCSTPSATDCSSRPEARERIACTTRRAGPSRSRSETKDRSILIASIGKRCTKIVERDSYTRRRKRSLNTLQRRDSRRRQFRPSRFNDCFSRGLHHGSQHSCRRQRFAVVGWWAL